MDDLISRQAAINALCNEFHGMISDESMKIYQIINWLSELPCAQPKKGKWMKAYADIDVMGIRPFMRYCSECQEVTLQAYNYCPNCGARMER